MAPNGVEHREASKNEAERAANSFLLENQQRIAARIGATGSGINKIHAFLIEEEQRIVKGLKKKTPNLI